MNRKMLFMANKPKKDRSIDRHKPGKMARIRQVLSEPAEQAAEEMAMDFTEWVNQAVREKLEREGRWNTKS